MTAIIPSVKSDVVTPELPVRAPSWRPVTAFEGSNVVFFGNSLTVECQRCGAYCSTGNGHKYCAHVTCPIALKEFRRRKRKRTSTLEKVYMPRMKEKAEGHADDRQ